jgi:hypothetical protein
MSASSIVSGVTATTTRSATAVSSGLADTARQSRRAKASRCFQLQLKLAEGAEKQTQAAQRELSDQLADAERRLARAAEAASNDSKRGVFARSERIAGFIITALRFSSLASLCWLLC